MNKQQINKFLNLLFFFLFLHPETETTGQWMVGVIELFGFISQKSFLSLSLNFRKQ